MVEEIIDSSTKPSYNNNDDVKINKCYLLSLLIFDIFDFIYSNFYYVDQNFKNTVDIVLDIDPFKIFTNDLKPKGYLEFLEQLIGNINRIYSNIYNLIDIFLEVNEIHGQQQETIKKLQEKDETWYVIYVPFNHVGFSSYCWIVWKAMIYNKVNNSNKNISKVFSVLEPSYILDIFLPIIAALIKREQNFKFKGMEILLSIVNLINDKGIESLKNLKNYNYLDVLKDLIKFIYTHNAPETKKGLISKNYYEFIRIFSDNCKKELYLELISQCDQDHEVAFLIDLVKQNLNKEIKKLSLNNTSISDLKVDTKTSIFNTEFLKKIITSSVTDENFPIDALETISQGCNFLISVIGIDKKYFNCSLGICEKSFLEGLRINKLQPLVKIIGKWERGSEDEKKKYLRENEQLYMITKEAKSNVEKVENNFNLRKNQANCTLRLISILENVIHKNTKE